ncbi:MAG: DUF6398 domain-containing protein [Clostridiales bacterium]|jgi:hypothetical protein|nr:DUF6398 domain-containing protein [Clostridiales bacterium]
MPYDDTKKLYGVCGISDPIKETLPDNIPFIVETVLLPFRGKIIYDGLFFTFNVSFGKNIRESVRVSYNEAKEKTGIIESFGVPPLPAKPPVKKAKTQMPAPIAVDTKGANVPKAMSARYMEIAEIIEDFCDEKLNAEYKDICLRALQKLCRKRPSPLQSGRVYTWASGIVYAIGANNFIFDRSQPLYMPAAEIAEWFGLAKSTAATKAAEVNKYLNLSYTNTEFLLQDIIDNNSMLWLLNVNGFILDIRKMPRNLQEEAFQKGLIPYIPADRAK